MIFSTRSGEEPTVWSYIVTVLQHASANSEINISFIVGTENFKLETINDHKCYKEVSCIVQVGSRENGCNEGTSKQNVLFRSARTIKKEREAI